MIKAVSTHAELPRALHVSGPADQDGCGSCAAWLTVEITSACVLLLPCARYHPSPPPKKDKTSGADGVEKHSSLKTVERRAVVCCLEESAGPSWVLQPNEDPPPSSSNSDKWRAGVRAKSLLRTDEPRLLKTAGLGSKARCDVI